MTSHTTVSTPSPNADARRSTRQLLGGGLLFLVAYLMVSPVSGALADRDAPLPDDPAADLVAYLQANPYATVSTAVLQVVSVLGLLVFLRAVAVSKRTTWLGVGAVAAMVASSGITLGAVAVAGDASESTVSLLRQASFYTGGVVHVVALGAFVLLAGTELARAAAIGRKVRIFGRVAGTLALLSIVSIAVYYANAFLPLGRLACMLWIVTVGITMWRRRR